MNRLCRRGRCGSWHRVGSFALPYLSATQTTFELDTPLMESVWTVSGQARCLQTWSEKLSLWYAEFSPMDAKASSYPFQLGLLQLLTVQQQLSNSKTVPTSCVKCLISNSKQSKTILFKRLKINCRLKLSWVKITLCRKKILNNEVLLPPTEQKYYIAHRFTICVMAGSETSRLTR